MTESTDPAPPLRPYRLQPPADVPEPADTDYIPGTSIPRATMTSVNAGGTGAGSAAAAERAERYGVRPGMSRGRKIGLAVVGLAILGGVAGYIGWEQSHPALQYTVLKFTAQTDSVAVTFEVDKDAGKTATCTLQALDKRGSVVGSVAVQVPAGRGTNVMSYTLSTTSEANTVQVAACSLTS